MGFRLGTLMLVVGLAACSPDGTGNQDASDAGGPGGTDGPGDTDGPTAALDTDEDGLSDEEEAALGTNPADSDTDNDGVLDGAEVDIGSDPLALDTDLDGLSDGVELALGSDPTLPDTDGDTLLDSEERTLGTNPALADTDGDGLDDAAEIEADSDPLNPDTDEDGLDDGDEIALSTGVRDSDSDNDQLLDGAEVAAGTDPLDVDTDSDRLIDGLEIVEGTDPLDPDTDADGLTDFDEIDEYKSDPLDGDTDNDGLLDGDEANVYFTSLFTPDTDKDGLLDGDEVFAASDPKNPDTDGDLLTDGDEVNVYFTDPVKADSDGGTLPDGVEVSMGLDPLDPADDVCTFLAVDLPAGPHPGGAMFEPVTMRVAIDGVHDLGLLHDFEADGDGDGDVEPLSSSIVFTIEDEFGADVCTVRWDGDQLTPGTEWPTDSGGELYGTWALNLTADSASTDCPPIDADVWGVATIPELFDGVDWQLGVGELTSLVAALSADVAADGGDWVADWEPYVVGTYLKMSGPNGVEMGYVRGEATTCAEVDPGPTLVPVPPVGGGIPRMRVHSEGYTSIDLSNLTQGQACADGVVMAGMLPSYGGTYNNLSLGWLDAIAMSAAEPCQIVMTDIPLGFTQASLEQAGIEVAVMSAPGISGFTYTVQELDAVRSFVTGGRGFVVTYVLDYGQGLFDYSSLADLLGVDTVDILAGHLPVNSVVTVLDPSHPVALGLPNLYTLVSYPEAQLFSAGVSNALLPGATIVIDDATGSNAVVTYDAAGWRSVWTTAMADWTPIDTNAERTLMNAMIWAAN